MRVKIGDKIYDAENEPIMLILSESDKKNIAGMVGEKETKYCAYPENVFTGDEIIEFMKE